MKRVLFVATVAAVALASFGFANRAPQPYRVVFDLTSRDSLDQKAVVRWIKEVSTSSPTADIEVVMYAKGFELVMPDKSNVLADVQTALKNPKVAFKVCAIALKKQQRRQESVVARSAGRAGWNSRAGDEAAGELGLHQGRTLIIPPL
jgi:intracellular sulfur oxidation DsrE/DsrF family protein